jgi:hypothetical protein
MISTIFIHISPSAMKLICRIGLITYYLLIANMQNSIHDTSSVINYKHKVV